MANGTFLYVCARPQRGAAEAEYESFRSAMRIAPEQLDHLDLVRERLDPALLARYRGFVVGGSPFNVTDPESTKTDAQRAVEADLRTLVEAVAEETASIAGLFTCYGIGIATAVLGGTVSRGFPEDTGPVVLSTTPEASADPLFGSLAHRFSALTAHKEGTATLPPGATLLATSDECPVQAYRCGQRLYATQFHPEPTAEAFIARMAVYRDDGYFESAAFDEISGRVRAASITEPTRILAHFAKTFGEVTTTEA